MDKPVLMSVVQSLLDNQAMNFKTTIELMTGDLKNEIRELRREVSDLKIIIIIIIIIHLFIVGW